MSDYDDDRGENERYSMFSREGNDLCEALVLSVIDGARNGEVTRPTLRTVVRVGMDAIAKAGHPEVWDTEPDWQIAHEVSKRVCEPNGWLEYTRWGEEETW